MEAHFEDRIFARFDGMDLNGLCIKLLSQQLLTWPKLREGYDLLKGIKIRTISYNGFTVRLQHNEGRVTSTLADTRPETIEKRPCFLCLNNLFEKQKGILYKDYLILCNPAPVFPHHLTINSIEHTPQRIESHIRFFLELSKDLGDNWIILYNGPKCGASAPDHLHFQAIPRGYTPLEEEIDKNENLLRFFRQSNVFIYYGDSLGRIFFIFKGHDIEVMEEAFDKFLTALKIAMKNKDEPMLNIACMNAKDTIKLIVFPRKKHRPDAYFKEGEEKITISPAVIEMLGVIVAPIERDFLRLKGEDIESIYKEVTMDKKTMETVISNMS